MLVPLVAGFALASPVDDKIVLFDGKSLDGWKKAEMYKPGEVKVEDGAIVIGAGGPMSGVVIARSDLPTINYELTYEAKRIEGNDFFGAATFPVGSSFVTFVNGGWGGGVTGISSINGADASENSTRSHVKYKNETWYKFRVRVSDDVIRAWVDDKEVCAVEHKDIQLKTRVETRPCQPWGFATYRSVGAVRSVEVRKLSADEVAANAKVEP